MTQQVELCIVRVANTPTEAQLFKNALAAVDIQAYINDANLLQANAFLTGAVGGVKVFVAQADLEHAKNVLLEWDSGTFILEGEQVDAPPVYKKQDQPLFSPEAAMALSMLLTPAFAIAVEIANLKTMNKKEGMIKAVVAFTIMAILSLLLTARIISQGFGFLSVIFASIALGLFSFVSFLFLGKEHSRFLINEYGVNYSRRPIFSIALIVGISSATVAGAISYFLDL